MISFSVGKQLASETTRLLRELPHVLRDALAEAEPELVSAAEDGLAEVQPRADGSPALTRLADNLHAEVRNGKRGPALVLTGAGSDERGIPYARVLNVHAHGVRRGTSKSARKRRADERSRMLDAHVRARAAHKKEQRQAARDKVQKQTDLRLMLGDADEHARQQVLTAAVARKREERRAARKPPDKPQWRLPPRNPMGGRAAVDFGNRLLQMLVDYVRKRWR